MFRKSNDTRMNFLKWNVVCAKMYATSETMKLNLFPEQPFLFIAGSLRGF